MMTEEEEEFLKLLEDELEKFYGFFVEKDIIRQKGCDASVLISGASAEMAALQNSGLRGFEVVDDTKSQLAAALPGVVSCADILALAARDAVDLSGGPSWSVPTGRRHGRTSSASEATSLPSPADSVAVQRQKFVDKGLNDHDLVTLVGAHTIGQTDCLFFRYQFYNFTTTGNADPTINQSFLNQLQALCPLNGDPSKRVALVTDSRTQFDVSYFKNARDGQGVRSKAVGGRHDSKYRAKLCWECTRVAQFEIQL